VLVFIASNNLCAEALFARMNTHKALLVVADIPVFVPEK
jgi:hypothetical protein